MLTLLRVIFGFIVACLVAGVVEVLGGPGDARGLTPIQVHVGAAFLIVAFLVEHVTRHWRPRLARGTDLGRRRLLRTAAFGAGAAATFVAVEAVGEVATLVLAAIACRRDALAAKSDGARSG